jgi:hypothetical protein
LDVNVTPAEAKVELESNEPVSRAVKVEGVDAALNGGQMVSAGVYTLRVSAPLHEPVTREIRLDADERLSIELARQQFSLTIQAAPASAQVRLVEPALPYSAGMKLPAGNVRYEVAASGMNTIRRSVTLDRDMVIPESLSRACRMVTVSEKQCSDVPVTDYRHERRESSREVSAEADVDGRWGGQNPIQLCATAKGRARSSIRSECDGDIGRIRVECDPEIDCDLDTRYDNFGNWIARASCTATATATCTSEHSERVPFQRMEQQCQDVPVQREVCD